MILRGNTKKQRYNKDATKIYFHCLEIRHIFRRIAEAKLASDCGKGGNINREDDSSTSFPVKKIHRAVALGFSNAIKVSCRSCYSCAKCRVGDIANCEKSKEDKGSSKHWLDGQCSHEKASQLRCASIQVALLSTLPMVCSRQQR